MMFLRPRRNVYIGSAVFFLLMVAGIASATHSWGGYHWARAANPVTLRLGDNVSSAWDQYLATASVDWSQSGVLNTAVVPGTKNPKTCKPSNGQVEVCNSRYGNNGWLGIASVWASGTHITQGVVKMNDTYFNTASYNAPAWRNLVMCQEVGHTLGLNHQDEDFSNTPLGTCMDYSNDPVLNQHPNQHDYDMLEIIYAHLDAVSTIKADTSLGRPEVNHDDSGSWGREIQRSHDGRVSLHERDFGKGEKVFTFIVWAEEQDRPGDRR